MIDIGEIKRRLESQVESVARHLLPGGKLEGREWVAGSVHGEAGRSLKVCVSGSKLGVWRDFGGDDSDKGDLLNLWCATRQLTLAEALKEAKDYLGIVENDFLTAPKKKYRKPDKPKNAKAIAPDSPVMKYLKEERKLTPETIKAYNIGECSDVGPWAGWKGKNGKEPQPWRGPWIIFSYRNGDDVHSIKYLHLKRNEGKKVTLVEPGCMPTLFGWRTIPDDARALTLTEGELDAPSLYQYGHHALSVPFGGGAGDKQQWVEYEWENLERFEVIYLAMDTDEEGQLAAQELIKRLGIHRCKILKLPLKDANLCLQKGITKEEIDKCYKDSKFIDPEELKPASAFQQATEKEFYPDNEDELGTELPWQRVDKSKFLFRPSEWTLWTGTNGHGKALSIFTPILTESGWQIMEDMQPGDVVFDEHGVRCKVVAISEILWDRPCYKIIFSDFSEIICDENHEWLTWTAKARASHRNAKINNRVNKRTLKKRGGDQTHKRTFPKIVKTKQIAQTVDIKEGCWEGLKEHSVKICGSLSLPEKNLSINPYILGAWLGDGHSHGAVITSADPEIIEYFKEDYDVVKYKAKYNYGIRKGLYRGLRQLNILKNKHIPSQYLMGSDFQRLALLQGLMDTDGHIDKKGRCEFTSVKKDLAKQVLFLVKSLGIQARMLTGRAMLYGKDCGEKYRVTFTPDRQVFRLERKVRFIKTEISDRVKHRFILSCEKIEPMPVKCIEVDSPSHLYLAGESLIPTHNSQGLGHCMVHAAYMGEKICIASLEQKPRKTLARNVRQIRGQRKPELSEIDKCFKWLDGKFWLFDLVGTAKAERIFEVFEYAYHRYGIKHFVIDSLMRCGIHEDDYNKQAEFANQIADFVNKFNCHIHLVAHPRKKEDEEKARGKMDVKGTGTITDLAHNVVSQWRNKKKEKNLDIIRDGGTVKGVNEEDLLMEPDAQWICDKQREGEWEGFVNLWFNKDSFQYHDTPSARSFNYLRDFEGHSEIVEEDVNNGESLDEWN